MKIPTSEATESSNELELFIDSLKRIRLLFIAVCVGLFTSQIIFFILMSVSLGGIDWNIPLWACSLLELFFFAIATNYRFEIQKEEIKNFIKKQLAEKK